MAPTNRTQPPRKNVLYNLQIVPQFSKHVTDQSPKPNT